MSEWYVLDVNGETMGEPFDDEAEAERFADRWTGAHVVPVHPGVLTLLSFITVRDTWIVELLDVLRELEAWAALTGGWDAPAWTHLKRALNKARREGR